MIMMVRFDKSLQFTRKDRSRMLIIILEVLYHLCTEVYNIIIIGGTHTRATHALAVINSIAILTLHECQDHHLWLSFIIVIIINHLAISSDHNNGADYQCV